MSVPPATVVVSVASGAAAIDTSALDDASALAAVDAAVLAAADAVVDAALLDAVDGVDVVGAAPHEANSTIIVSTVAKRREKVLSIGPTILPWLLREKETAYAVFDNVDIEYMKCKMLSN